MHRPLLLILLSGLALHCTADPNPVDTEGEVSEEVGDSGSTDDAADGSVKPEDGYWLFYDLTMSENSCGPRLGEFMQGAESDLMPLIFVNDEATLTVGFGDDSDMGSATCAFSGNTFDCPAYVPPGMTDDQASFDMAIKMSGTVTSASTVNFIYGFELMCKEGRESECQEFSAQDQIFTTIPCEISLSGPAMHCGPLDGPFSDACSALIAEYEGDDGDDDDINDNDGDECALVWPEDPFHAAVYSFVAEYGLGLGPAVGCYLSVYPDQTFGWVAIELEDGWYVQSGDYANAVEYAQAWVDAYGADYPGTAFDVSDAFSLTIDGSSITGGLGYLEGGGEPSTGDCEQPAGSDDDMMSVDSYFEILENPHTNEPALRCMTHYVNVLGLSVYAESGLTRGQVAHAAAVLAELLDNNEDGVVDDQALYTQLLSVEAMVPMFNRENSPAFNDFISSYQGMGVSAVLFANEVDPTQTGHWGSDATVEEIMHTINHRGHVEVYPEAFGLEPGASLMTQAMDVARGGQFMSVPTTYPEEAWYHYDDTTCDYECMAIEYIYWAQVTNMGILDDPQTCAGIANEWEPCSKALLESMDPLIYELITDPTYKLPQNAPDGVYGAPAD